MLRQREVKLKRKDFQLQKEILACREENPRIQASYIARKLGVSRQCIHETLCKMSLPTKIDNLQGMPPKPVTQLTFDGVVVESYSSQVEAERETGIKADKISLCTKGKALSAGGYMWVGEGRAVFNKCKDCDRDVYYRSIRCRSCSKKGDRNPMRKT